MVNFYSFSVYLCVFPQLSMENIWIKFKWILHEINKIKQEWEKEYIKESYDGRIHRNFLSICRDQSDDFCFRSFKIT